ncbi:type VI secretion system tip protein VgrG [Massilia horti]|uniref:Type VI secretion system tip protein VgrG n=2 Tax=Massilia horti TaxID=2562153 RepID=A0A4Y9T2H0_9BURK|nr:type VI secretion system tip protein VgrG [Massilia horti]
MHLSALNRPLRLRFGLSKGQYDERLLPHSVTLIEGVCEGLDMQVLCVAEDATIPLKELIGLPTELQVVTDRGTLRPFCGIVTEARAGDSDGGLATYQLVVRDALAVMEMRVNTRVFINKSELEIVQLLCTEWRQVNAVLAAAFELEFDDSLSSGKYPRRALIMQANESDAAFLRRLLKRRGICWHFRAGRARNSTAGNDATPAHTLVMFDEVALLKPNAAGRVRYHRDDATEERDTITSWCAARSLQPSGVTRFSWDYLNVHGTGFMHTSAAGQSDQGPVGNHLAATLDDYLVEVPHAADSNDDLARMGRVRMARHDLATKCFYAEGTVRDLCVGEYFALEGHPEIQTHVPAEREFVVLHQHIWARSNLSKDLSARVERLFARSQWRNEPADLVPNDDSDLRYRTRFTCVRRGIPIVPDFDTRTDLPRPSLQSAMVVGPPGEVVHCDAKGRVKVRFLGTRPNDHEHARGAGASDTDADSAWVRVMTGWAGNGPLGTSQCGTLTLPRIGTEVVIDFMGGDPDKPVIVGQLYNNIGVPPALSKEGELPGNRYLSGQKSQEIRGMRANQLRFDDTPGQISAQLASDHGTSELNLGWLSEPRRDGQGAPRGEGAELRSDKATAVRGGAGVLISAGSDAARHGAQLDREGLMGLTEVLQGIARQLERIAATHAGDPKGTAALQQLTAKLARWHDTGSADGGKPIVAVNAEAGMLLATQANLLLGAQTRIDVVCPQDTAVAAGQHLALRAGRGATLFAQADGIKIVTASGAILVENHNGDIEVKTPNSIKLHAGQDIVLQSRSLKVVTDGAQANFGAGAILYQCTGAYAIKAATVSQTKPGGATPPGVVFPSTRIEADQRFILCNQKSGEPLKGWRYEAQLPDGRTVVGISDEFGRTALMQSDTLGNINLKLLPPEDN